MHFKYETDPIYYSAEMEIAAMPDDTAEQRHLKSQTYRLYQTQGRTRGSSSKTLKDALQQKQYDPNYVPPGIRFLANEVISAGEAFIAN